MGLGHATRSLPIIQEFKKKNWNILVGSSGRALGFLREELPATNFISIPDYRIEYAKNSYLLPKLVTQVPRVLKRIYQEHKLCKTIVRDFSPDIIFSDHCYGFYHGNVPSVFMTHQIYFSIPKKFMFLSYFPNQFNSYFQKKYDHIFIPDSPNEGAGLLSGHLSKVPRQNKKYHYIGFLSSIKKRELKEDIDLFISISGPEPQRTNLQNMILEQVKNYHGNIVIVLGKSERIEKIHESSDLTIFSHLPRRKMEHLINRAKLIVGRPGYTTLLELIELGKKALLIPTPGQTEQIYLAQRIMEKKWFYCVEQRELNLVRDVKIAKDYQGKFLPNSTEKTVQFVWDNFINRQYVSKQMSS
jgi:uncharacterized protein (TIGR00661 family)